MFRLWPGRKLLVTQSVQVQRKTRISSSLHLHINKKFTLQQRVLPATLSAVWYKTNRVKLGKVILSKWWEEHDKNPFTIYTNKITHLINSARVRKRSGFSHHVLHTSVGGNPVAFSHPTPYTQGEHTDWGQKGPRLTLLGTEHRIVLWDDCTTRWVQRGQKNIYYLLSKTINFGQFS